VELGRLISHISDWAKVPVRLIRSAEERRDWAHEMRRRRRGEPAPPHLIEDPWGREQAVFEAVFRRIVHASERLAALLSEGDAAGGGRQHGH